MKSIAWHPTRRSRFAAVLDEGDFSSAVLWDTERGRVARFESGTRDNPVHDVSFSAGGSSLLVAGGDRTERYPGDEQGLLTTVRASVEPLTEIELQAVLYAD